MPDANSTLPEMADSRTENLALSSSKVLVGRTGSTRGPSQNSQSKAGPRSPIQIQTSALSQRTGRSSFSTPSDGSAQSARPVMNPPPPPSPRQARNPSLTHAQVQELLIKNPSAIATGPTGRLPDPRFKGRDWHNIALGELLFGSRAPDKDGQQSIIDTNLQWVDGNTCSVEEGTNILVESGVPVLLLRGKNNLPVATFDYRDLNQYLLFATGQLQPLAEEQLHVFQSLAKRAQTGQEIPLRDAISLAAAPESAIEAVVTLPKTAPLAAAVELFGGGIHRIFVTSEAPELKVLGLLSQSRLVRFLWENGRNFPVIDHLYGREIRDLAIGNQNPISINGDRLLKEALILMHTEGITSLAVVDAQHNVVGNISNVDVKLLTKSSSAPLLENTCIHFISVILSTRGMNDGKDSFPVFYITPHSTLAHTVAKLIATSSHRMWLVDSAPSQPTSTPSTPLPTQTTHSQLPAPAPASGSAPQSNPPYNAISPSPISSDITGTITNTNPVLAKHSPPVKSTSPNNTTTTSTAPPLPISLCQPAALAAITTPAAVPQISTTFHNATAAPISAAALPGQILSGRLTGVVSLTDILNLYARASGLHPEDPQEARRRRRGSSSSSRSSTRFEGLVVGVPRRG